MAVLYFVRHGAAEDTQTREGSDFDRPLTEKGRKQMTHVAKSLAKAQIEVDLIVTSPLVRARDTATILAKRLGIDHVLDDRRLADGFDVSALQAILHDHASVAYLMLVGHEPTISAVVGRVIGGAHVDFKKGAIACVDLPAPEATGTLLWLAPPKLFSC
jgi:phosphohistidine phosphatase